MDIYHFGKEDLTDDHKVVHERLLEVAIPDPPESGGSVTLEECLENYFNNKVEVKRLLNRRNTLQSMRSYDASKSQTVHIETTELRSRSPSPASPLPKSPMALKSPTSPTSPTSPSTPTSPKRPLSSRHRTDSIFGEKRVETGHIRKAQDDASVTSGRQRAGTIRKEVLMPAWQFFSLIRMFHVPI